MSDTPSNVKTVNIGPSSPTPSTPAPTESAPVESSDSPIGTDTGHLQDTIGTQSDPNSTPNQVTENTEEDPKYGDRFAALSREEAKIRESRLEMKADQAKLTEYNDLKASIKENPMAALAHLGIDLDSLIMSSLGEDAPVEEVDAVTKLQKEFEDYKNGLQEEKDNRVKAESEANDQAIEAAVNTHKQSIEQSLIDNADKYELITLNGAQDMVWEVTEAHFDKTNEVLSPEEAADLVEAHLDAQFQKQAAAKKYNKEPIQDTAPTPSKEPVVTKLNTPTLSNSTSTNTPQSTNVSRTYVDREASKRDAASLLKWNK